jgi:hypothetical protein
MTEGELRALIRSAFDAVNGEYRKLLTPEDFMIPKVLTEREIEERALLLFQRSIIGSARGISSYDGPGAIAVLWRVIQIAEGEIARIEAKAAAAKKGKDENGV